MSARRFTCGGLAAVLLLAVAGCKSQSSNTVSASEGRNSPRAYAHPTTAPSPDVAVTDSASPLPDALAQKTAEYARTLESPGADHAATRTKEPSPVQWDEPGRGKERATPNGATAVGSAANTPAALLPPGKSIDATSSKSQTTPAVVSARDATHAAAVADSAKSHALNDVPAIVPESSDFAGSSNGSAAPDALEQQLARRMHDNPRDVSAQLDFELFQLLRDEASPQLASLSALPNEDKEVVAALVDGISNFRTGVRQDQNMLLSKKIRPLMDMADRLRSHAELSVPTVALCKRVDGFGKYEPIDPPRFPAGRENPVIVYCEIQNFESQLNDKRLWETRLTQQVTLYTETGMMVWPEKSRPVTDECRNRRHDFFLFNVVKLPANLTIGRYLLKVSIEDRTAHRVAESTVPVEIVGQ